MTYTIVSFIFIFIGAIFVLVSFLLNISIKKRKKRCTKCIEAKIVDIKREYHSLGFESSRRGFYFFEYYEYNYNNNIYNVKNDKFFTTKKRHEIGQFIKLYINPNNPKDFYNKEDNHNILIYIFSIVGTLLLIVSLILIIISFN